ncbi:MAG: hypothetical protein M3O71_13440 [Bacteroidota bacterium]|nr:hypothetical protein [Bacteroidota bacterium]
MKYKHNLSTLLFIPLIFLSVQSFSQARSGIGFAYGPNKPFSNDYNWGSGFQVFGNIAISGSKWAIVPNIGYEKLNSKGRIYYDPANLNNKRISNIDLFYLGAMGKYCFNKFVFVKAGPLVYAGGGNEDIATVGIGGTAAGGVNLIVDRHNTIEASLFTTIINIESTGNGITPVAGFKFAYVFNFRGED